MNPTGKVGKNPQAPYIAAIKKGLTNVNPFVLPLCVVYTISHIKHEF